MKSTFEQRPLTQRPPSPGRVGSYQMNGILSSGSYAGRFLPSWPYFPAQSPWSLEKMISVSWSRTGFLERVENPADVFVDHGDKRHITADCLLKNFRVVSHRADLPEVFNHRPVLQAAVFKSFVFFPVDFNIIRIIKIIQISWRSMRSVRTVE